MGFSRLYTYLRANLSDIKWICLIKLMIIAAQRRKFPDFPLDFSKSQGGNSPLKVGGERILGKFSGGNPPLPPRDRGGMTTLGPKYFPSDVLIKEHKTHRH